jgi:hypothetical protein
MSTHTAPNTTPKHEAFVEQQLARARGRVRTLDLMGLLLLFVCLTLGYALLLGLVDRAWKLPSLLRLGTFLAYAAAALYVLGLGAYRCFFLRVNPLYAARRLEEVVPDAKNSVVNWLDLRDAPMSPAIRNSLGLRAAKDLAQADPEKAIVSRRTVLLGGVASGLACMTVVALLWWGPGAFFSLLQRNFAPFSEIAIATSTNLELLLPEGGNLSVNLNQKVDFRVGVTGRVPRPNQTDSVKLHYRYNPNDPYVELLLEQDPDGDWATALLGDQVHNGFWYKITAGDAATPEYQVRVRSLAQVLRVDVTYKYRPYLKADDLTVSYPNETSSQPHLKALRGTEVTLVAHTNRAVKEGRIEFDHNGAKRELIGELDSQDPKTLRYQFVIRENGMYRFLFRSAEGEPNSDRFSYRVEALTDHPPMVKLTVPGKDVALPANGTLTLEGTADDDHGIKSLSFQLRVLKGGTKPELAPKSYRPGKSLELKNGRFPEALLYKDFIALEKVKTAAGQPFPLAEGMELEYWLEAVDNCDYPEPDGNVGRSDKFKLTITAPEKNQEKQKQERQRAEKQQQQHEKKQDQDLQEQETEQKQNEPGNSSSSQPKQNEKGGENQQKSTSQDGATGSKEGPLSNQEFEKRSQDLKNELDKQAKPDRQAADKGQSKSGESPKADGAKQGPGPDEKAGDKKQNTAETGQACQKKDGGSTNGSEGQAKGEGGGQQTPEQPAQAKDAGQRREGSAKSDGGKGGASDPEKSAVKGQSGSDAATAKGADKSGRESSGASKGADQSAPKKDQQLAKDKGSGAVGEDSKGDVKGGGESAKQGATQSGGTKKTAPDANNADAKGRGQGTGKANPSVAKNSGAGDPQRGADQPPPGQVREHSPQTAKGNKKTGGPHSADASKGQSKEGGASGKKGQAAKAEEKSGPGGTGNQVAEAKGDAKSKSGSGVDSGKELSREEFDKLKDKMRSGDVNEREKAAEKLAAYRDRAMDPKTRGELEKALKEAGRDPKQGTETAHAKDGHDAGEKASQSGKTKNGGNARQSPRDAGNAKGGKADQVRGAGATRGAGKNDIATGQAKARTGGDGSRKDGQTDEPAVTENNPEVSKRAGDLQLEDLKKVTPDMLKKMNWSEKDLRDFRAALEARRREQPQATAKRATNPDQLQHGGGIFSGKQGARKLATAPAGKNAGSDFGPAHAPEGFQEAQRIFTSLPLEKRRTPDKK